MMKIAKVSEDGAIYLPANLRKNISKGKNLAVWSNGDVIILKKLNPPFPSEFAGRSFEKEPPLREIAKEVHGSRRERRKK